MFRICLSNDIYSQYEIRNSQLKLNTSIRCLSLHITYFPNIKDLSDNLTNNLMIALYETVFGKYSNLNLT